MGIIITQLQVECWRLNVRATHVLHDEILEIKTAAIFVSSKNTTTTGARTRWNSEFVNPVTRMCEQYNS